MCRDRCAELGVAEAQHVVGGERDGGPLHRRDLTQQAPHESEATGSRPVDGSSRYTWYWERCTGQRHCGNVRELHDDLVLGNKSISEVAVTVAIHE